MATKEPGKIPEEAGVFENTSKMVDWELLFTSSQKISGSLKSFVLPDRPTIVVPVYYKCPRLCTLTLNGLLDSLREQDLKIGEDFSILTVSFAASEGPELALAKQNAYHSALVQNPGRLEGHLKKNDLEKGWQFLTGDETNIKLLMNQLGFKYMEDEGEYSHASAMMLLTAEGQISHYLYGFPIKGKVLRMALVESSKGIIGSAFDRVLLYCFRFDPTKGQYTLAVLKLMQVVGFLTILGLGSLIFILRRQEKRTLK